MTLECSVFAEDFLASFAAVSFCKREFADIFTYRLTKKLFFLPSLKHTTTMAGYQVTTPNMFTAGSVASPFSAKDSDQDKSIYNLQNFARTINGYQEFPDNVYDPAAEGVVFPIVNGNLFPNQYEPGGGFIPLPEYCTDPNTPFELNLFQMLNQKVRFSTPVNTGAYPEGQFETGAVKVYYVKGPLGLNEDESTRTNYELFVQFWQLVKGTYGFNQIPVGFQLFSPHMTISRGTAVCYGFPTNAGNPKADPNGVWWYALYVNQLDYTGAPLELNVDAATAMSAADKNEFKYLVSRTYLPTCVLQDLYSYYDDLAFATLFPEEYNTPASKCPVAQMVTYGLGQQTWPQPL